MQDILLEGWPFHVARAPADAAAVYPLLTMPAIDRINRKFTKMTSVLTQPRPIRLKGRSFLALSLSPELPLGDWLVRLDDLASRSTGFFMRRPVVLDIAGLEIDRSQLRDLVDQLAARQVRIMGIEGARPSLLDASLPPAMADGRPTADIEAPAAAEGTKPAIIEKATPSASPPARAVPSLVVTEPVRSGQSLIFVEGDVTIVGSVASGAEIVAGGSIHVYGTLRGRALAGTMGNATARIFCRKMEAELVAIDGYYKAAEDLDPGLRGKAVQFWLEGDTFKFGSLA
jgi:septum site-determining protein MinC